MAYHLVTTGTAVVYAGTDKVQAHDEYKVRASAGLPVAMYAGGLLVAKSHGLRNFGRAGMLWAGR